MGTNVLLTQAPIGRPALTKLPPPRRRLMIRIRGQGIRVRIRWDPLAEASPAEPSAGPVPLRGAKRIVRFDDRAQVYEVEWAFMSSADRRRCRSTSAVLVPAHSRAIPYATCIEYYDDVGRLCRTDWLAAPSNRAAVSA
jgi:hypothetical protein